MSFIKDVADERERNSPVRAAIKANAKDIQTARATGLPLNAIYRALRRKGHAVGKGYSSFRMAVRYLDRHGWPNDDAPVETVVALPVLPSNDAATGSPLGSRDRFVDDRNASDF